KPTARRRKAIASREKEASSAVDITAAPSAPIEAATRALKPEKRQRPRRAVKGHDGGGGDSSNPAAAAAAAATNTPSSKTKPRRRKAALAPASYEDSDAPSPETDSETSPAVLPGGEARPTKRSRVGGSCGKRSSEGNGRDDHTAE
ncbi:unnamed protein product, partial [Ectocarpus sp. 12 AP-2014]